MALVLQDVLSHAAVAAAEPVVLSGATRLNHRVRWVHSADLYDIASLLRGDEVLLTNGVGLLGVDEPGRRLYIRRLAERGVAGLLFEVGRTFDAVPEDMVDEARALGLPVVELRPVLRFTEVAEAVNGELLDRSVARLRHADETSRSLSEALARGASIEALVAQVAETLGSWARLTDHTGRVVVRVGRDGDAAEPVATVPVTVDGTSWGRLSVGSEGPDPVLLDAVLERAPLVLGLGLLRQRQDVAGVLRAQQALLETLAAGRPVEEVAIVSQMRAAGVAVTEHSYVCLVLDPERVHRAPQLADEVVRRVGHGVVGTVGGAICALVAGQPDAATPHLSATVRRRCEEALHAETRLCAVVGRSVDTIAELPLHMDDARSVLDLGQRLHHTAPVLGAQAMELELLLETVGDVDAVARFVRNQIGPLRDADRVKGGQLIRTLEALVSTGGSKTAAARRLHMRRQSFYYRLGQIRSLLEADLDDPDQFVALAVALRAQRLVGADEPS